MFNLINKVTYFQAYFPEKCQFDWRSENVGVKPNWTTDYVMNEANRKEVEKVVNEAGNDKGYEQKGNGSSKQLLGINSYNSNKL